MSDETLGTAIGVTMGSVSGIIQQTELADAILADPLMKLSNTYTGSSYDVGLIADWNSQLLGMVYDASDTRWKLFSNATGSTSYNVDFTSTTFAPIEVQHVYLNNDGKLRLGTDEAKLTDLYSDGSHTILDINNATSDFIVDLNSEGGTGLVIKNSLANEAWRFNADAQLTVNNGEGAVTVGYGNLAGIQNLSSVISADAWFNLSTMDQEVTLTSDVTFGSISSSNTLSATGALSAGNISAGTYNPTESSLTNISLVTVTEARYFRFGSTVMVFFVCSGSLTPTGGGSMSFAIDLPVVPTANFTNTASAYGSGTLVFGTATSGAYISSVSGSKTVLVSMEAIDAGAHSLWCSFSYSYA